MLKKVSHEEDRSNFAAVTMADIDRTMKKYSDNLLHALEGVSSRLSQMERRTHQLENSVDDLKLTIGNYNGSTEGKLRHLENMLREVSFLCFPCFLLSLIQMLAKQCYFMFLWMGTNFINLLHAATFVQRRIVWMAFFHHKRNFYVEPVEPCLFFVQLS